MISYYTAIMIIIWLTLLILSILVSQNDRISQKRKRIFFLTNTFLVLSAFTEWLGIQLSGNDMFPTLLLKIVKCCDYILTPLAGAYFARQMRDDEADKGSIDYRINIVIKIIVAFNFLFQIVSVFTGWMITIDNKRVYHHGPLYKVYVAEYLIIIFLVVLNFLIYGKNFKKQNKLSLYSILVLVLAGIILQETFSGVVRTSYLGLTIGTTLLYIHITEFSQQLSDNQIKEQQIKITTDALTGLLSRHAYSNALSDNKENLSNDFAAFSIDINGLKEINDTLGHSAGDELICGVASCIEKTFGKFGECYRTGGDEFIVLANIDPFQIENVLNEFKTSVKKWKGEQVDNISVSCGFAVACDYDNCSAEELVRMADSEMYLDKEAYYKSSGKNRRV